MPLIDALGDRMKGYYEQVPNIRLMRRTPVIIRVDGKAFHSYTRGFDSPMDKDLMLCMRETMRWMCGQIQGCVLGYCQSDEISFCVVDYKKLESDCWFDYKVQKVCSISAALATYMFNHLIRAIKKTIKTKEGVTALVADERAALFDARAFNIPENEVTNYFYWRQLDTIRNSINLAGHTYFSNKEMNRKKTNEVKDMLLEKGINWDDYPSDYKYGTCAIKQFREEEIDGTICTRSEWILDHNIPIFKGVDMAYVENRVLFDRIKEG